MKNASGAASIGALVAPQSTVEELSLLARLLDNGDEADGTQPRPSLVETTLARLRSELQALALWNDPGHMYLHCLCEAP